MIGAAIRAVYAKAAALPGSQPRESMLQDELRAQAKEAQDQDAVDVAATLRNLADRLSRVLRARAPTPTCSTATRPCPPTRGWWCSTPAAARNQSCGS